MKRVYKKSKRDLGRWLAANEDEAPHLLLDDLHVAALAELLARGHRAPRLVQSSFPPAATTLVSFGTHRRARSLLDSYWWVVHRSRAGVY